MKNIVLIGFMGTGKTSVGRLLAGRLGCAFHDLDKKIEEACGISIPQIFAQHGENAAILRENGVLVALTADVDTILQRTAARGARPVLDGADAGDRRAAVVQLLEERRTLYAGADITVDTSRRSPLEVAEYIVQATRIWRK